MDLRKSIKAEDETGLMKIEASFAVAVLHSGDSGEPVSKVCKTDLLPVNRLGVLFEWWITDRLRLMAGGVALSSGTEAVDTEAEEGPVTMEAFDDLRFSLGPTVSIACV